MNFFQLRHVTMIILAAFLFSGCSTSNLVEGRYSYDRSIDFSKLKSFAFGENDMDDFSNPENVAHFRTTMTRALSEKGFTENPKDPDFLIVLIPPENYVEQYTVTGDISVPTALLRVNFANPSGGKNFYESVTQAFFDPSWPQEELNSIIENAVKKIVETFPPGK